MTKTAVPSEAAFLRGPPRLRPDFELGGARLYLGLWPIAIIDVGNATKETYVALFAKVDELVIARRLPYVMLTDTRRVTEIPGADVRKFMSEWMKKNSVGHTSLGSVTIVRSSLVRGALTALYWLFQPPNPQGAVMDWPEALAWSLTKLDAAGLRVEPMLRGAAEQPY